MGAESVGMAVNSMKKAQSEMVQWENTLASIQAKVKDLSNQRDQVQKQIDEKVANANIQLAEERAKIEKERQFVRTEREKLEAGKVEMANQIETLRSDKQAFEKQKEETQKLLERAKYVRANVDQFIIAVQRAYTVLGG